MNTARRFRIRAAAIGAAIAVAFAGVLMPASAIAATPPRPGVPKPAAGPTVTAISPTSGPLGSTVTITGTGFTAPATVNFTGTSGTNAASSAKVLSATKLTTTVNSTASTGPVTVTTAGSTVSAGTFTVTTSIRSTTTTGVPGSTITLYGAGFTPNEAVDLYAGTTDQQLISATSRGNFTSTGFTIPTTAQPGAFTITAVGRKSGLSAQATYTVNTDWTQQGFGAALSSRNPYENTISTSNVANLAQEWANPIATGDLVATAASSPTVVGGVVYVGSQDDNVYALNAATGAKIWAYKTGGDVGSTPAVAGGLVYVGSNDDNVYALNATTGAKQWSFTAGGEIDSSPTVSGGIVYIGCDNGAVYALNALTGAIAWSYITGNAIYSTPAVANGLVYVTSLDDYVYALNSTTGALSWRYKTGAPIEASPAVGTNGLVYIGSEDDYVYALLQSTGRLVWGDSLSDAIIAGPAVSGNTVYAASNTGPLTALNAATGAVLWSTGGTGLSVTPVVANGVVYAGSGGSTSPLTAYDASSGAQLHYLFLQNYEAGAAVANGVLYTVAFGTQVAAYSLASGIPSNAHPKASSLHPDLKLKATRSGA